jgi:hypothetical protein
MSTIKITAAAVLVLLAFGATAASTASAGWFIEGAELSAGSKVVLTTKATVTEPFVLSTPKLSLKISCSGLSGVKPELSGASNAAAEHLEMESCSEIEPKTCKMESPTIVTEPVVATPSESAFPDDKVLLGPKTGKTIMTITFVGSCSLAGEKGLNGRLNLNAPTLQENLTDQQIEALGSSEGNNSLEIGGQKTYLEEGKTQLELTTGSRWVFIGNNASYSFAQRVAGSVMSTISFCYFDKTNDWCEIQVEVIKTGTAAALKFATENIEPPTEPFIKKRRAGDGGRM